MRPARAKVIEDHPHNADMSAPTAVASSRSSGARGCAIILEVDISEIQAAFDDLFDQALVFHGFADYMRDHDVFVYVTADTRTGIAPERLRYRFKHCVRAVATSALSLEIWKRSLDERFVDYEQGRDLNGYVWGSSGRRRTRA
jgi:hypothetical protein